MVEDWVGQNVRIIFLGQDPRVQSQKQQSKIRHALGIGDPHSPLDRYVVKIATRVLGLPCSQAPRERRDTIFGTNLIGRLYDHQPTEEDIWNDGRPAIANVRRKLVDYPLSTLVVCLGEPVLKVLANDREQKLSGFWGAQGPRKPADPRKFQYLSAPQNALSRQVFPFPHLNSYNKRGFYWNTFEAYSDFCATAVGQRNGTA